MNQELEHRPSGGRRPERRWTLRRLSNLVLNVVRLCAAFHSSSGGLLYATAGAQGDQERRSPTKIKSRSSKHQPSLLELSQPDSWHQLHRDIQQRLQCGEPPQPTTSGSTTAGSREQNEILRKHQLSLSGAVQRILTASSWTRTPKQVELAVQELQQSCNDFRDYPVPLQYRLAKVGWYLCIECGRVIFREGQPASCFYFLLSGSVLVASDQEPTNTLTAGTSFGDQAIIDQCSRTMTCTVKEQVELFAISKSDFLDLCLRQARISYQRTKHFAFCKTVCVLKHWPMHMLEAHPDQCKVVQFKINTVVVKDSTKNPWVYVIMTGSCRVVKRFIHGGEHGTRHPRKSHTHPAEFPTSKLALVGESVAARHAAATGTLTQRNLLASRKNKHSLSQDLLHRKGASRSQLSHAVTSPQLQTFSERKSTQAMPKKQFLVQLQLLQPKDTFGLSSFLYSEEPSVTLVSNGAEMVLLSKEFLLQHFNETIKNKLKRQISQFPSQEAMLKRIRDHYSWNVYKQSTVSHSKRRI